MDLLFKFILNNRYSSWTDCSIKISKRYDFLKFKFKLKSPFKFDLISISCQTNQPHITNKSTTNLIEIQSGNSHQTTPMKACWTRPNVELHMLEHRVPHVAPVHPNQLFSIACRSYVVEWILDRRNIEPKLQYHLSFDRDHMLEHCVQHVSLLHQN